MSIASSTPQEQPNRNVERTAPGCDRLLNFVVGCAAASTILYLLTATFAVVIAYRPIDALLRYIPLTGGVLFCLAAIIGLFRMKGRQIGWLYFACGVLAAALVTHAMFGRLGFSLIPVVGWISGEAIADALVVLLPLAVGGFLWLRRRRKTHETLRSPLTIISSILVVAAIFGLMVSGERSAIAALLVGAVYGAYAWWRPTCNRRNWICVVADLIVVGIPCVLVFLSVIQFAFWDWIPLNRVLFGSLLQPLTDRLNTWNDVLSIAGDYRFTGSGLGAFSMVLSTYVYLLHVPYLNHAYNLYLQVMLEQGAVGMSAFLLLIGNTVLVLILFGRLISKRYRIFYAASAASVGGMLIHGLVDSSLYASKLIWVVFIPLTAVWLLAHRTLKVSYRRQSEECGDNIIARVFGDIKSARISGALIPVAVASVLFMTPGTASAVQMNWGAVQQTAAELSIYSWPDWSIQDQLRLSDQVKLQPAIQRYYAALAYDNTNSAAHRRLGQIALSRKEYDVAIAHFETALLHTPTDQVAQRLLGEAHAVSGHRDAAVASWQNITFTKNQIENRLWWYGLDPDPQKAIWLNEAITEACLMSSSCE